MPYSSITDEREKKRRWFAAQYRKPEFRAAEAERKARWYARRNRFERYLNQLRRHAAVR